MMTEFDVVEASIAELRRALEDGRTTSVALVRAYRARIEAYDRSGPHLNSVIVDNPHALDAAAASDARRSAGTILGPLDGIPYTAKDSFMAAGLTVAAGSPAFENLIAHRDAFTVERLRAAGAVLLGLTNMPPMANGGMQRGLYGRAESPYNSQYLTSAFGSGSSNGSGTATAASFAAFGLGEETWSSGRAPASHNALCAYTPSRGLISTRGNWPLVPTMDVVVPHTRSMADLFEVLDVIVADDTTNRGDFWRRQPWIPIAPVRELRPPSYRALGLDPTDQRFHASTPSALAGLRLGVPRMYVNADPDAGTGTDLGIGGPTGQRIETRGSILQLWESLRAELEAAGAEVVSVDFPLVSNYERDRPDAPNVFTRGIVAPTYFEREIWDLSIWAWDDFLRANGDPRVGQLADVDGSLIFPHPEGALPDRYGSFDIDLADYVTRARAGVPDLESIPEIERGLKALDHTRKVDFDDWLADHSLDAVVFPAVADVGPADADRNPESADAAWQNGVWVANGNLTIRHFGLPTVTVPMGLAADIGMPVGLTITGLPYDDTSLLQIAAAITALSPRRTEPPRTPRLRTS